MVISIKKSLDSFDRKYLHNSKGYYANSATRKELLPKLFAFPTQLCFEASLIKADIL